MAKRKRATKAGGRELLRRWQRAEEGQFLERKGAWDYSGPTARKRKATDLAKDVAETVSAMANADGGEVVVGLEDDGRLTGIDLPGDRLDVIKEAPRSRCRPPVPVRVSDHVSQGKRLLHFAVEWSPEVHDLTDGRTLLRRGDSNVPFSQADVAALKRTKQQGLLERHFPPGAILDDVDLELVDRLRGRLRPAKTLQEILAAYYLVEERNGRLAPNFACLLLFGRDPLRWHPRCDIDFVRFEGTRRETGPRLNVIGRERVQGPLAVLIERAYDAIRPHVRTREALRDLFFQERLEYPTFAWQEAIVNAVAHRDYGVQGAAVEVQMFSDQLVVQSPGPPPAPVTIEALRAGERVHASRNPLIVRTLTDLGYMRELGEGIPRMFEEMQRTGLHPPELELVGGASFQVRLRNEPIYDAETLAWLTQLEPHRLSSDQRRLLAYARSHGGTFTSRAYQKLARKDIYQASNDIKDLIRKGLARSQHKGGRVYELVLPERAPAIPPDLRVLLDVLRAQGFVRSADVRSALGVGRRDALKRTKSWIDQGWLVQEGTRKGTKYCAGPMLLGRL